MSDIKLCKDCRWFSEIPGAPLWFISSAECTNPATMIRDYVRGDHTTSTCASARLYPCGPDGKLWEPRE